MEFLENYGDSRIKAFCVYCGGWAENGDHVPSKVLLDSPYPNHLPIVPACSSCNAGFSLDEEYVACLLEAVIVGDTADSERLRPKVRRILEKRPQIKARIDSSRVAGEELVQWRPEWSRVENVIGKLALGHAAYELNEVNPEWLKDISFVPAQEQTERQRAAFENAPSTEFWPEVGSRALQRMVQSPDFEPRWVVVQPGRYRYLVVPSWPPMVKLVLSEYLLCEIYFHEPTDGHDFSIEELGPSVIPVSKHQLPMPLF